MRDWSVVILFVVVLVMLALFVSRRVEDEAKCSKAGGKLMHVYRADLCLTDDGRVIRGWDGN